MTGNQGDYGYTRDVIASGRRLLTEIDKRAPSGVRWVVRTASATRALPAPMQELIATQLLGIVRTLSTRGREALASAEEAVNTAGSPTSLRELADRLDATVRAQADDLAPRVRSDALEATDEEAWSGKAAGMYRSAVEGQGEAVKQISECAKDLAQVCRDLAGHLDGFVWYLTGSIIGLVGALATLVAALDSIPASLGAAIASVGGAALLVLGAFVALGTTLRVNAAVTEQLAEDAQVTVRAWPNSRFGGK